MISRMLHKTKGRFFIFLILLVVCISIVYIYLMYMQENFRSVQWSEKRCLSELTSVKSQLNVVTEYKNRIEKMLSDTQKSQNADKDKFKDVMDSFKAMKQQSAICQSQFDDIQSECKKCREMYNQGSKELLELKGQYQELQKTHEKLQNAVKEQYNFIDTLRNENARLQDSLQAQAIPSRLEPGIRHYNNKSFAHQLPVNDDVYKIDFKSNIINDDKNKVSSKGPKEIHTDNDNQLVQSYKMNMENKVNKGGEVVVPNALPPGFAPILPVENVINSNLPKPIETVDKLKDHNKQDDPDLNKFDAFENNANIHDIDINDGIKIDETDLNMPDQNQNVEEDEDDGEEYPT